MASELQILVTTGAETDPDCLAEAWRLLDALERRWSRFRPDSDITRLNNAAGTPIEVDRSTITLLATMVQGWEVTAGAFDPSILASLCAAGYDRSIDDDRLVTLLPDGSAHLGGLDAPPSPAAIEFDAERAIARLPAGMSVDPGGIGKGLAADLAVGLLIDRGAAGALVSIGGDMVVRGTPPDGLEVWTVAVEHPLGGAPVGTLGLCAGGVATSSTRSRRWRTNGGENHHVIDPATDAPSTTDLAAVSVIGRSGWLAEVHATAALLAGTSGALDHLDRHELSGLAVGLDGSVSATADLHLLDTVGAR